MESMCLCRIYSDQTDLEQSTRLITSNRNSTKEIYPSVEALASM